MWLLDIVVGFFDDCCSLLGLIVDAASYLLLSRKWCPPWEDGADADPMLMAMTEAFVDELIGDFRFDDVCSCCCRWVLQRALLCCRLVL